MRYVVEQYSFWMVVTLVLGLTAGWVAARQPNAVRSAGWVYAQLLLAAIGWGVVYAGVVRGTAGLWFESFVLLGSTYLAGCIIGSLAAPRLRGPASDAAPNP
jgi:hypothetical protein